MTDSEPRRKVTSWSALGVGGLFGVGAAFLAAWPYLVLAWSLNPPRSSQYGPLDTVVLWIVWFLFMGTLVTGYFLTPAILGGIGSAWALQRLAHRRTMTRRTGILVGASVGALIGGAILLSARIVPQMPYAAWATLLSLGIGALAGVGHGWAMTIWLRRHPANSEPRRAPRPKGRTLVLVLLVVLGLLPLAGLLWFEAHNSYFFVLPAGTPV